MKKIIAILMCCNILMFTAKDVLAYAKTTTEWQDQQQIVYTKDGNIVVTVEIANKDHPGEMWLIGRHALSKATISYWTVAYNISLDYAENGDLSKVNHQRLDIIGKPDDQIIGNEVVTKYKVDETHLIDKIQKLLIKKYGTVAKANKALEEGIDIYLSNIFRVYRRPGGSGTLQPSEKDFISGELHNLADIRANQAWSAATMDYLQNYYNIRLQVKVTPNHYDIVYVDEGGQELKTIETGNSILAGAKLEYEVPPEDLKFEIDGVTYKFAKKAAYWYEDKSIAAVTVKGAVLKAVHQKSQNAVLKVLFKGKPSAPTPTPEEDDNIGSLEPNKTTSENIFIDFSEPEYESRIAADKRGEEAFDVEQGIPTTENLYAEVKASDYLFSGSFTKINGRKTYLVPVSKTYTLRWTSTNILTGEEEEHSDSITVKNTVSISREYSYTQIDSLDCYQLVGAKLNNYALPGESISLEPQGYLAPTISFQHYEGMEGHVKVPEQIKKGVTLASQTIYGGNSRPSVPSENFKSAVDSMIPELSVRNDSLIFNGTAVLNDAYVLVNAPEFQESAIPEPKLTNPDILYQPGLTIDAEKANGEYPSTGLVSYTKIANFRSSEPDKKTFFMDDTNDVIVHTPVYCIGTIKSDNAKYVQLLEPDTNLTPIVLDETSDSADFTVEISNYGFHSDRPGYGYRDYSKYVLRNEVSFPFDVYIDIGNDKDDSNDRLLNAYSTYKISGQQRFYTPMWVTEGNQYVWYQTIAVNGEMRQTSQQHANTSQSNYVATDGSQVQISGKVYGLTLYDISASLWKPVFRQHQSSQLKINKAGTDGTLLGTQYQQNNIYYYTVGTKNQMGIGTGRSQRFTFPLVTGSHPQYKNQGVLKAGYLWRFTLDTIGSQMMADASYVKITPRFFYVDSEGKNREEVDLYYSGKINGIQKNVVQIGSDIDSRNIKTTVNGSVDLGIPGNELKQTAAIRRKDLNEWSSQFAPMFTYGGIRTDLAFKTFSNAAYADIMSSRPGSLPDAEDITSRKQSWYFEYGLPIGFKAVSKDFDLSAYFQKGITYHEDFWKKNGYIIINFDITCYDSQGKAYLSYINTDNYLNNGNCCMWIMEGAATKKTDYYGAEFEFKAGDTILISTDKTKADDYEVGGIY